MDNEQRILPLIFLSSWASLAFEVLLTRLYSIAVSYHFAAMIISIAMFGIALSGVLLSIFPKLGNPKNIGTYSMALGIAIPVSFLLVNHFPFDPVRLAWEKTEILRIGCHYLFLAVPFLFTGLAIASAFASWSSRSGLIYGADLLGAATGSVGILALTSLTSPERGIFLLAAAMLAALGILPGAPRRMVALVLAGASLALFHLQPQFTRLKLSPYKGLEAALRYPGATHLDTFNSPAARIDTFRSPAARFAPGLSLKYLEALPRQTGIAVDGGDITAHTDASDPSMLQFLSFLPAALPYEAGINGRVLVLDPGGGLHLLLARHYGAVEVIGMESNPLLARVCRQLSGFSPFRHDIRVLTGTGRTWLAGEDEAFDLIDIPLQGASPSAAFGMAEDYRLTVEAFRDYLSHLRPDGALCVNLFLAPPPRMELRILATAATALEELGVRDASRHVAAVRSWGSMSILVKRSPLNGSEVKRIRRFARDRWFDPAALPGLAPGESNVFVRLPSDGYYRSFAAILSSSGREVFTEHYLFDIRPVRDDAPFFNHFLRLGNIGETYRVTGGKWQFFLEEGYLFPAMLLQAGALGSLLILVPVAARRRAGTAAAQTEPARQSRVQDQHACSSLPCRWLLPYFALIGIGFMFAEIVLVQKLILPLGNATYALAAVLASLLAGSGAGSILGQRYPVLQRPVTLAAIALLIIIYGSLLQHAPSLMAPLSPAVRFAVVSAVLLPLGLPMGIPFPAGMKRLGERDPSLIPWAWVINGSFSVMAPLMALMLALVTGFGAVAYLAAGAYLLAFLVFVTTGW